MSRADLARPEDLGDGPGRLAPPQLELEQPIARRGEALREEQVGLVLRVDVVDAPAIADDLDPLRQARACSVVCSACRAATVPPSIARMTIAEIRFIAPHYTALSTAA